MVGEPRSDTGKVEGGDDPQRRQVGRRTDAVHHFVLPRVSFMRTSPAPWFCFSPAFSLSLVRSKVVLLSLRTTLRKSQHHAQRSCIPWRFATGGAVPRLELIEGGSSAEANRPPLLPDQRWVQLIEHHGDDLQPEFGWRRHLRPGTLVAPGWAGTVLGLQVAREVIG